LPYAEQSAIVGSWEAQYQAINHSSGQPKLNQKIGHIDLHDAIKRTSAAPALVALIRAGNTSATATSPNHQHNGTPEATIRRGTRVAATIA
jgi:hypothetical protein